MPFRFRRTAMLLPALLIMTIGPLSAQAAGTSRPWTLAAGAITYRVSSVNGWAVGPSATAQRRVHNAVKFDFNAAALLSSGGFYDFSGIALDAGPSLNRSTGSLDLGIGAGIAFGAGSDSDGTGGGWVGGYVSGQGIAWFSPRAGLLVRGAFRQMSTARTSPSAQVALALRL
ncbi:MAG TPA: hypothetical protein VF187_03540 [Gemmatimonadales bacterium]